MKSLALSALVVLVGTSALAGECRVSSAQNIALEGVYMNQGKATIEASGPGGFFETYNYTFKFTNSIVGFAATENFYNGYNFHMSCNSLTKACDIKAVVPRSSQMDPGVTFTINGVVCK